MESESNLRDTWSTFVDILSNDIVQSDTMVDILKKAKGILNVTYKIFLRQNDDSTDLIIQKRFWLRWLIRRLLVLCIEHKKCPKVKEECLETFAIIMKKAIFEPCLHYTLTEHYVMLLEGKFTFD